MQYRFKRERNAPNLGVGFCFCFVFWIPGVFGVTRWRYEKEGENYCLLEAINITLRSKSKREYDATEDLKIVAEKIITVSQPTSMC